MLLRADIIDFAIVGEALDEVLVIEINPVRSPGSARPLGRSRFGACCARLYEPSGCVVQGLSSTSGCLFNWVTDKKTIYEGAPFEFRLREAPDPELRTKLRRDWAKLLDIE